MEDIDRRQPGCLSAQEAAPRGVRSARGRAEAGLLEDAAGRSRADVMPEADQLALDATMALFGIFAS
ncbi:hypothetical protein [Saccharopolyspora hattusasensis]|uniref:hypothetical protein n=1 Tax=Saccharopolyspora hattusasensis TaxID=1128679 RepID=UPI003D979B30